MQKNLSKETSQKIKELGVDIKTEKWHWQFVNEPLNINRYKGVSSWEREGKYNGAYHIRLAPAPNLQELLLALKEIGEKAKWGDVDIYKRDTAFNRIIQTGWNRKAHILTDIFLEKGMEGVDKYILELISE